MHLLTTFDLRISTLEKKQRRTGSSSAAGCRSYGEIVCVPGCIDSYAPASGLNGGRQNTVWLLSASVAMATQHQLNLEDGNEPHVEDKSLFWGKTDKEKRSHPALIPSLTARSGVAGEVKQARSLWITRSLVCRCVYPRRELPFTPFNCYSFPLSLTSPPHNAPPLCAELQPLCANLQPPHRGLPSQRSSFITMLVHISITCLFNATQ